MADEKEYVDVLRLDVVAYTRPDGSTDYQNGFEDGVSFILDKVNNLPREKVAPIVHGHWIYKFQYQDGDYCYCCSRCGRYEKVMSKDVINTMPYCHCGAKMGEGKNNGSEIH